MSRSRAAVLALAWAGAAACASFGGIRPREGPLPGAVIRQVPQPAAAVITDLAARVAAAGLTVRTIAPSEGFLETDWYDLTARRTVPAPWDDLDRVVKLRFTADPVSGKTRLVAECIRRTRADPSVPQRELEQMVSDDHPGRQLLNGILQQIAPPPAGPAETPRERVRP